MASAVDWFQIPASDMARAKAFYETICGFALENLESPPNMEMWAFSNDWRSGEVGGAVVCGEGAVPSATGTMVFLNGDLTCGPCLTGSRRPAARSSHPRPRSG